MDSFPEVVKYLQNLGVGRALFESGLEIEAVDLQGQNLTLDGNIVEDSWLTKVIRQLSAKDPSAFTRKETLKGNLPISALSKVIYIAHWQDAWKLLLFFPPQGEIEAQDYLDNLTEVPNDEGPSAVPPPPLAAGMIPPPPGAIKFAAANLDAEFSIEKGHADESLATPDDPGAENFAAALPPPPPPRLSKLEPAPREAQPHRHEFTQGDEMTSNPFSLANLKNDLSILPPRPTPPPPPLPIDSEAENQGEAIDSFDLNAENQEVEQPADNIAAIGFSLSQELFSKPNTTPAQSVAKIQSTDPLLDVAIKRGASDLFLRKDASLVALRVDGEIEWLKNSGREFLDQYLSPAQRDQLQTQPDLFYSCPTEHKGRLRIHAFSSPDGLGMDIRLIPPTLPNASDLNLPAAFNSLSTLRSGLILVCSPAGEGKSTCMAAFLSRVNQERSSHILTLESPIEFVHEPQKCLITQREISDASSWRSVADAEIVQLGEISDMSHCQLAIELATSGRLVIASLTCPSIAAGLRLWLDRFPRDMQESARAALASQLSAIIAINLCRKRDQPGRIAAFEALLIDDGNAEIIRSEENFDGLAFKSPSQSQTDALLALLASQAITLDEAMRVAQNPLLLEEATKKRRLG